MIIELVTYFSTLRHRFNPKLCIDRRARIWPGTKLGSQTTVEGCVEIGRPSPRDAQLLRSGHISRRLVRAISYRSNVTIGENCTFRSFGVIYASTSLADHVQTAHFVTIREGCRFDRDCYIKANTYIGVSVMAGARCTLAGLAGDRAILKEDTTSLGALVHKSLGPHRGQIEPGPTLEQGAFVGRNCTIIGGVHLGEFCYVAAGSVITKDIPPRTFIRGEEARSVLKNEKGDAAHD